MKQPAQTHAAASHAALARTEQRTQENDRAAATYWTHKQLTDLAKANRKTARNARGPMVRQQARVEARWAHHELDARAREAAHEAERIWNRHGGAKAITIATEILAEAQRQRTANLNPATK